MAFFILAAEVVIAALTFRHYGLGWDDYTHAEYGQLLLDLYRSGFADQRAFSFVNLFYYGGGFDMAAALAAKILPYALFESRRLIGALVGIAGLAATWRLGRRLGGPIAGLIALALLAFCPVYDGHMYVNAKDSPFAVAMIILLLAIVRAFDEYPRPAPRTVAFVGIAIGLAFGSRVLAALSLFAAFVAMLTIAIEEYGHGRHDVGARLARFIWLMLPAILIGYLIMGLLWPWAVLQPLNPLRASDYFSHFFEKPWREMYQGRRIEVTEMPASYLPHMFSLKLPEIMIALGLTGTVLTAGAALRGVIPIRKSAGLFAVVMAALFPVVLAMVARPALYNGIRHFLFVIPPFAVLGGLAGAAIFDWARARGREAALLVSAAFLVALALPASDIVRLHPFQYSSFNRLSGGIYAAKDRYMLDYWGLAFKQAGEALREELDRRNLKPRAGRRWIIEICGPQRGAELALGPDFETVWDRTTADFAMMLGTYYCRDDIRAPILVEIWREGVLYARVYDIRGMRAPNLLTEPPPQ
ncbi:MAG: glycosyltransferase family 39 protein [Pseudolabrys sp.]|nr:glycosyltransferase family 39 protein [Pseudolabrys sp.]